ncbi:Alpha/beta hydrolase family-domain-containing protein [Ganoderma leucocontextum]|nr:Alpha/beta hydrolase family-domain-containing protein [Ganoderma leucocontextum]
MLDATNFIVPGVNDHPKLACSFVRWRPLQGASHSASPTSEGPQGSLRLSLVFLHCNGTHKETWLPTVEHMFDALHASPDPKFTVIEAWAADSPHHGHAARLNDRVLLELPDGLDMDQWNAPIKTLFHSGLIAGDRVVGIGHSAGTVSLITITLGYALDRLPFSSMILIEPPMMTPEVLRHAQEKRLPMLRAVELAKTRKDVWSSREEAREWFGRQFPWRRWDKRVFDFFVDHALHDLPTATYPNHQEGVTLACTRAQDSAAYTKFGAAFTALDRLTELCASLPVHCIFGDTLDMVPAGVHDCVVDEKAGRRMKSVRTVSGAGHLAVQDNPRDVAFAIQDILIEDYGSEVAVAATACKL